MRFIRSLVALAIATAAVLVCTAGPASADSVQTFRNRQSGMCLDDSDDANHFGIRAFPCNGLNFQQWNVHVFNDGTRQLRNLNTQRCLGVGTINGVQGLLVGSCVANTAKSWNIERLSNGIRFFSEALPSKCLWDNGGNFAGGHFVGVSGCIGGYYPLETIWY